MTPNPCRETQPAPGTPWERSRPSRRLLLGAGVLALAACGHDGPAATTTSRAPSASAGWRTTPSTPHRTAAGAGRTSPVAPSSAPASAHHEGTTAATPNSTADPSAPGGSATSTPTTVALTRDEAIAEFSSRRPTEWGLHTTGTINRGSAAAGRQGLVALTFDACGGPGGSGYDEALITLLRRLQVRATLTLNARWVQSNPTVAAELGSDPLFEVQSHGMRHLPLSVTGRSAYGIAGTRSVSEVYDELTLGTPTIAAVAHNPIRYFRAGTAYCDDVAAALARRLGTPVVGFSINGDAGATFTASQVEQAVGAARGGDIVLSHMNQPTHQTAAGYARVLPRLLDAGIGFAHLSQVA